MGRLLVGVGRSHLNMQVGMDGCLNLEVRAVTNTGAAGAMHRGSSTRRPRFLAFYCKISSLKVQVNLILLNVTLHQ